MKIVLGRIDESQRKKKIKLDQKDRQIISYLSEDSRIPLTQLRKSVKLSRDSIKYRIKRLIKNNVLVNFFPIINLKRFGFFTFHTFFLIDERNQEKTEEFIDYLISLPFVKNIIEYSDIWDLEIVTVAKNVWDYDQKINQITSKYPEMILEKEKMQVIKGYNSIHLPNKFYDNLNIRYNASERSSHNIRLDKTDIQILSQLCEEGRAQYHDIALSTNLTPEAVKYRVKKMYDANVIRKYSCQVNLSNIGYHWFTFMMQAKTFNNEWDRKVKKFVMSHPYIIRAVKTLGRWDFLFYIVAENPRQFHNTAKEIKQEFSDIIRKHDTLLTYKEYYFNPLPEYVVKDFKPGISETTMPDDFYREIVE